jgi:hypothetical protein
MTESPRLKRKAGLERGHGRFLASQLTLAG